MSCKKTILVIDDDADDLAFFREAVTDIDDSITCFIHNDGHTALDMIRKKLIPIPDYIFLDLNMPKMDGRECLKQIMKDKELSSIPVVIYSTSNSMNDIDETKKLGASHYLTKSEKFTDIKKNIRNFFQEVLRS